MVHMFGADLEKNTNSIGFSFSETHLPDQPMGFQESHFQRPPGFGVGMWRRRITPLTLAPKNGGIATDKGDMLRDPKQGRSAFEPKGKWAKGIICGCFLRTSAAFAHPIGFPEGYILAKPPDASMGSYMSQVISCILKRTFKELESPPNPPSHCQTGSKLGQGTLLQLWLEQTVTSLVVGSYLVRPSNTRSPIKTTPGK